MMSKKAKTPETGSTNKTRVLRASPKASSIEAKATVRKAVVTRAKAAAKSVVNQTEARAGVRPKQRVQTAEGWKRAKVRSMRAKKKA